MKVHVEVFPADDTSSLLMGVLHYYSPSLVLMFVIVFYHTNCLISCQL